MSKPSYHNYLLIENVLSSQFQNGTMSFVTLMSCQSQRADGAKIQQFLELLQLPISYRQGLAQLMRADTRISRFSGDMTLG